MQPTGFSVPEELVERLDKIKRDWDEREVSSVSRSDVGRETLVLGATALEVLDEYDRNMDTRAREAIVRQAIHDHFDEESES